MIHPSVLRDLGEVANYLDVRIDEARNLFRRLFCKNKEQAIDARRADLRTPQYDEHLNLIRNHIATNCLAANDTRPPKKIDNEEREAK